MSNIAELAALIVAIAAALGVLYKAGRWAWLKLRNGAHKFNSAAETLLGREEIRHPDTGVVLVEATPGLGQRLSGMEHAIISLSQTQSEVAQVRREVANVAEQLTAHITASGEADKARVEESTEMWKAIRAIASAPASPQ